MIAPLLAVTAVFILLIFSEYLWRKKILSSEITRKLIHIVVGVFVAFWPLFMSWLSIELISIAFIVVVLISLKTKLFKSIHSVDRSTWGELLFAVAIGLLSLTVHTRWIFAAAMLHLSLADGLAAIFGSHFGHGLRYQIFGDPKSVVGSLTFLIVSTLILVFVGVEWGQASWSIVAWLPLLTTATENIAVHGTDNLFVPLIVALGLRWH